MLNVYTIWFSNSSSENLSCKYACTCVKWHKGMIIHWRWKNGKKEEGIQDDRTMNWLNKLWDNM